MAATQIRLFLLLLPLALFGLIEGSGNASAHASLLQSTPADGSVLPTAPENFVLTFSEPVSPIVMRLVDADGAGIDLTQIQAGDETVAIALPRIEAGTHALSWRVISADGHPVGGSIVFSVGAGGVSGTIAEADGGLLVKVLIWSARLVLYFGLFVGVGGRFFVSWIAKGKAAPIARRTIVICLVAGFCSAVLSLGLQGLDALGVNLVQLSNWSSWRAGLSTTYAATLAVAAGALALALLSGWTRPVVAGRIATAVALLAIGAALALSGHASAAAPRLLTRALVFIHGVCVAFWVGALVPLAASARLGGPDMAPTFARFSRMVPYPVALLVASGTLLAVVQIEHFSALWTTAYGFILDAKIAAVLVLLGLAARNRFSLTRRVQAGEAAAGRAMARSIAVEVVLVAIVLALVATWRFTPPPRSLSAASGMADAVHVQMHGEGTVAGLVLTPGRVGPASVAIAVLDGHSGRMAAKAVTLTIFNPAAGVEPIRREAHHIGGANWTIDALIIPAPGKWIARVDILVSDFEEITLHGDFDMPP